MNDINRFCDATLAEELDDVAITNDSRKQLGEKFHKGKPLIETQLNVARLLMSEKAYKDLLSLDQALSKAGGEDDFTQKIAGIRVETEDCLFSFIPHAKEDLGVQKL